MYLLHRGQMATLAIGATLLTSLLLVGCKKNRTPVASQSVPPGGVETVSQPSEDPALSGPYAAGRKVFEAQGCTRCHAVNNLGGPGRGPMAGGPGPGGPGGPGPDGPGGPMPGGPGPGGMRRGPGGMGRGPDLGKVGEDAAHTSQWLAQHIRNPKAHKQQSRMPPYGEDKINADDMNALTAYLGSLK